MDKDAYLEINASQRPALALFEAMGYTYISPADCDKQRGSRYHVLLRDILRGQLRRLNRYVYAGAENEFSAANIERAMEDLDEPLTDGLVRTSEKIYDALLLGKSYPETVGDGKMLSFNLRYIDWDIRRTTCSTSRRNSPWTAGQAAQRTPGYRAVHQRHPLCRHRVQGPAYSRGRSRRADDPQPAGGVYPASLQICAARRGDQQECRQIRDSRHAQKFWSVWKEQDADWLQTRLKALVPDRMSTEQDRNIVSLFSPRACVRADSLFHSL